MPSLPWILLQLLPLPPQIPNSGELEALSNICREIFHLGWLLEAKAGMTWIFPAKQEHILGGTHGAEPVGMEKWETLVAENTKPGKPSPVLCLGLGSI